MEFDSYSPDYFSLEDILASTHTVAEGVVTARSAEALARKLGVDAPIINGERHKGRSACPTWVGG